MTGLDDLEFPVYDQPNHCLGPVVTHHTGAHGGAKPLTSSGSRKQKAEEKSNRDQGPIMSMEAHLQ